MVYGERSVSRTVEEVDSTTEALKTRGASSSYRPACHLDTMDVGEGNIASGLSDRQYGFRSAHSTADPIATVVDRAGEVSAIGKCHAVGNANWGWVKGHPNKLDVPEYLVPFWRDCSGTGRP